MPICSLFISTVWTNEHDERTWCVPPKIKERLEKSANICLVLRIIAVPRSWVTRVDNTTENRWVIRSLELNVRVDRTLINRANTYYVYLVTKLMCFKCFAKVSKPKEEDLKPTGKRFQLLGPVTAKDVRSNYLILVINKLRVCFSTTPDWNGLIAEFLGEQASCKYSKTRSW